MLSSSYLSNYGETSLKFKSLKCLVRAHSPEAVGSNPTPATNKIKGLRYTTTLFSCGYDRLHYCENFLPTPEKHLYISFQTTFSSRYAT